MDTPKAVAAFRRAVNAQIDRWDAERDLEKILGYDVLNLEEVVKDFATSFDDGYDIPTEKIEAAILALQPDGPIPAAMPSGDSP